MKSTQNQRIVITVEFELPIGYEGDWRDDSVFDAICEAVPHPHPVFGDPMIVGGLEPALGGD